MSELGHAGVQRGSRASSFSRCVCASVGALLLEEHGAEVVVGLREARGRRSTSLELLLGGAELAGREQDDAQPQPRLGMFCGARFTHFPVGLRRQRVLLQLVAGIPSQDHERRVQGREAVAVGLSEEPQRVFLLRRGAP